MPKRKKAASRKDQRSTAILVRVSKTEKARLKKASESKGYGVSTMLRALGLAHAEQRGVK